MRELKKIIVRRGSACRPPSTRSEKAPDMILRGAALESSFFRRLCLLSSLLPCYDGVTTTHALIVAAWKICSCSMNCCTRSLRRPRRLLRCPPLLHTLELMRRRTPIQSATTGVVAHTRVLLAAAQRGSGVTSAGLWSGHRRSTSTLPPTFLHTSHNGPQGAAMEKVLPSLEAERTPASPSSSSLARRRDHTAALPTHFMFDPPFTPVDGEAARKGSVDACLYACRGCNSPVFCSSDLVHGSRVGHHSSGWPTFVAPLSNSAVRLRTVLQKSVVANLSDSPSSGTTKALRVHVPDAGMAQRGLAVEGDLVRLRGRRISEQHAQSWRETCLRDGNHRSDPAVVLGCCGRCGSPVCQVTQSAVVGSRFVSTAACVRVLGPKERRHGAIVLRAASASTSNLATQRTTSVETTWRTSALTTAVAHASSSSRHVDAATADESRRRDAWVRFIHASRQLKKAVRAASTQHAAQPLRLSQSAGATGSRGNACPLAANVMGVSEEEEGEEDEALAALAPSIVHRTATAAASAALMKELGVIDRAAYRAAATPAPATTTASTTPEVRPTTINDATTPPRPPSVSPAVWTSYLMRVCQAGVQAHVSSFVILQHISSPFLSSAPQRRASDASTTESDARHQPVVPMLRWSASLPSPVRLQLLINETARIERCRRFIADGLRSEHRRRRTAVSEAAVADADGDSAATAAAAVQTRVSLSNTWRQSVLEARAVVRCCAAPWLVGEERNADAHSNTVEANGKEGSGCSSSREQLTPTATAALLTAAERGVMLACLRLAAACHGEDVGQHLMDIFINSVDVVVRGAGTVSSLHYRREEESQRNVEAFQAWYEADGAEVYEAAMTCVARECTRPTSPSSSSSSVPLRRDGHSSRVHGSGGFARAYAFFVHRAATTALLSHQDDSDASDVGRAPSAQARSSGSAWTTSLTHYPVVTMQLLKPLADCVDANAEHFNMVVQLYGRMLSETEVGYSAEDGGTAVRRAFAALLLALARVPLGSRSKMECLEDLYRRTLLNSSLEVVQHPDVLAGCLRVCGAARAANRSIALFNKLAEPSSRSLALQEENMAAVCLAQAGDSTSAPAAVLQRLLCFMQTRLPLTADVVQAAVATTLLSRAVDTNTTAATPPMTSAFAMLDLLTSGAVAQHRVTRSTAAVNAERTFFLRVVLLLTGASVTQDEPNSGAASSLHTPAAAAIFQQWVGEFAAVLGVSTTDEHGRRCTGQAVAKVAPSLSVVTVGALQELWVVLRRADCLVPSLTNSDEGNGRFAASATPSSSQEQDQPRQQPSPLAQAVRDMLAAIPPPVATSPWCKTLSVWPFSPSPSTAASAPSSCTPPLLVTLPPSFQWRQLMEVWPLAEQQRFMESFVKLFTVASPAMSGSPHPHSGEETAVCMRYHDYMLLEEVFGKTSAATEWADAARVWNTKGERTAASLQEAIAARLAGIPTATPVRALHVLSPLADVEGALQWSGAAAAATTAEASPPPPTVPLPQLLGVPVPPVPGCPVHSWAVDVHRGAADHKGDHARPRKVLLAVYWLTRWVDSVEDAALLPSPSLFRQAVIAAIDHSHLSEAPVQEAVHTTVSDAKEETGGENNAAAHDEEMKVNAKRGGIEEVLVRGPTSLLYDAAS